MTRFSLFVFILLFSAFAFGQTYLDPNAPIEERVDDLLGRMTLDEKIGQMTQPDIGAIDDYNDISSLGLGSILSGGGSDPAGGNSPQQWRDMADRCQTEALKSRLGIPLLYGVDAVHGHSNVTGAVIFPHHIGMGCTRNPDLVKSMYEITAYEVAATGIHWTFAPCIAVPQDERWGRTYEGFGETPALAQLFAEAAVQGCQGDLGDSETILACAKHYLGDGGTTDGVDQGNTKVSEAELRAIHLPGYIEAVNAGVGSIMASFNSWNDQKLHGQKYLLTDVLKDELGFDGFIVSDWAGIDQLPGDYESDVKNAVNAGIDMVMVPNRYPEFISHLLNHVQSGAVPQSRVDDAVRRILTQKFKLGLFERPFTDEAMLNHVGSEAHRAVARQAVQQSIVPLIKKDGVLPLSRDMQRIHVVGRHADDIGLQCGGWTIQWQGAAGEITEGTTVLEGLRQTAPGVNITYSASGDYDGGADVVVAVIGEEPYAEGGGDRNDLHLDEVDTRMLQSLYTQGTPVVVVLITGRPMILDNLLPFSDAAVAAWLPGTEGRGVADILFGDVDPVGKLSHTWPASMQQIPINVDDAEYEPLFAYGHGLSTLDDSPPGSPPQFYAASVASPNTVRIEFTKSMQLESGNVPRFLVHINGGSALDPIKAELGESPHSIILTVDGTLQKTDTYQVSYIGTELQSVDGGRLATFALNPVYNLLRDMDIAVELPARIEAESWTAMSGVQTESTTDVGGGINVGWIDDGDWMEYLVNAPEAAMYNLRLRIAAQTQAGRLSIRSNGAEIASLTLPVTGGWQEWTTVETTVELHPGVQTLRLYAETGGFNINWLEFEMATGVAGPQPIGDFQLFNYPNPFNGSTTIICRTSAGESIRLQIFDVLGRAVRTLYDGKHPGGELTLTWNGNDQLGGPLASGLYLLRLSSPSRRETRRLMLLQ